MSEKDGKLFKANSSDRWPSRVQSMTSSFEKECADARSLLDQLAKYLLNRSYNSSSDSFMKKMRELNVATFTVMEFNKTLEKLIPNENKFDPDGSDSESLYSCFDQPPPKSFTVNQWINKNDKCPQESSPKVTKQEVSQDHRDSTPESEDLNKHAAKSSNQIVHVNEASVKNDKSDETVDTNDLAVKNQNVKSIILKCRPMVELIARDSESIPETDSDSTDTSVHSESLPDDHFALNSASEDKVELNMPPQIPLEMNTYMDCQVTHVESPSRFYVVSKAAKSSLDLLIKGTEFDKSFNYTTKCELSYKLYYACFYDRTWSRVQVVNLLKNDVDDVEVFFIDSGRKEYVKYYNLTPLHEDLYSSPAIAYLCHLFKVTPLTTSNGVWTFAALKYMKNKVQGFPGKIMPIEFVSDSYGVLLSMNDKKTTTINLTMIIKNLAHDLNDTPVKPLSPKTPSKDQLTTAHVNIPPTQVLLKDEFIECVVTHVESPSSFYVTQVEDDGMPERLKTYYQEYKPTFKNSSECTQPFYACLHEDVWWRALVVDASSAANELTMFFLDSGLKTNINVSNVRPLAVEFCNVAPKAFLCHLFRVEPLKENGGWTNKAIKFMKKKTLNKRGRLCVENSLQTKFEESNAVILIVDSITLNITLVVKNLAQEPDEPSEKSNIELMSPNLNQPDSSVSNHEVLAETTQIATDSPEKINIDNSVTSILPQNNVDTLPPSLTNVSTDPSIPYNNFNSFIPTLPINNVSTMPSKDTPDISVSTDSSIPYNTYNSIIPTLPMNNVNTMPSKDTLNISVSTDSSIPYNSIIPTLPINNVSTMPSKDTPNISVSTDSSIPYSTYNSIIPTLPMNNVNTMPSKDTLNISVSTDSSIPYNSIIPTLPINNVSTMPSKDTPNISVSTDSSIPYSTYNSIIPTLPMNNVNTMPSKDTLNISVSTDSSIPYNSIIPTLPINNVSTMPSKNTPNISVPTKHSPKMLASPAYSTNDSVKPMCSLKDSVPPMYSPNISMQLMYSPNISPMHSPNTSVPPPMYSPHFSVPPPYSPNNSVPRIHLYNNMTTLPPMFSPQNNVVTEPAMHSPNTSVHNVSPYSKTPSKLPHSHDNSEVKQISPHSNVQMVPSHLPHNNDCKKLHPMLLPNNNVGSGTSMQQRVNDVSRENSVVPSNKRTSMHHLVKNDNWRMSMNHPVNDISRESPMFPNNRRDIVMSNYDFQSVTSLYECNNSIINPVVPDCGDVELVKPKLSPHSNDVSKVKSTLKPNKNVNAMSSVPINDDADSVKPNATSTETNNCTAELTKIPNNSISASMPKSSYTKVSTVPSLLPHFCNVGASPSRLPLHSNSRVPSKMPLSDDKVPSLMSMVCNWPTLGSPRRNEVNHHQFMGQVLDLDLPAINK